MTLKDHEKHKRDALRDAARCVKKRDWLMASNFYRIAVHHADVVKAAKKVRAETSVR